MADTTEAATFEHPYAEMVAVLESAKAADVERVEVATEKIDRWATALVRYEPPAYPACGHCGAPFVLRWGFSLTGGSSWFWQRDCAKGSMKACKAADVETRGPLAQPAAAPCEHTYNVALLAGVATGQPCTKCGEPYDPKAGRR